MVEKLIKLLDNSYSPYSKFRVSAIVIMNDGREFYGVNVENAAYGSSICAERSAMLSAISAGYKKNDFASLHVLCGDSKKISMPCFGCRQFIVEFFSKDSLITAYNKNGDKNEYTVDMICPFPFENDDLDI